MSWFDDFGSGAGDLLGKVADTFGSLQAAKINAQSSASLAAMEAARAERDTLRAQQLREGQMQAGAENKKMFLYAAVGLVVLMLLLRQTRQA